MIRGSFCDKNFQMQNRPNTKRFNFLGVVFRQTIVFIIRNRNQIIVYIKMQLINYSIVHYVL